jgi:tetratricopeptide (TPR) repeat protein
MKPEPLRAMALLTVAFSSFGLWRCVPPRPNPTVSAVEAHSEALVLWLERGIRGATLVHVDAHDDLRKILPEKVAAIEAHAGRGDLHALRRADSFGEDGLYHEGSFVTAALRLGIIRNVVWVTPDWDNESAQAGLRRVENRGLKVPLEVCTLETMPDFPDPVLLGIDLDFLPEFARERGLPELEAARRLVLTFGKRAPRRLHVVMSYSTGDGYTPILLRWLGDAVLDMLGAFPSAPSPEGERLWAFLQRAEDLRRMCDYDSLVRFLKARPPSLPGEPARLLYLADALYLQDEVERSFDICRDACRLDKRAAGIFFWVGKGLAIEGRLGEAARFIDAGRDANPGARDWEAETYLALGLKGAGRDAEALAILERLAAAYNSFSAEFLIGEMLLKRGDRVRAERRFNEALRRLAFHSDPEVDLPEVREAAASAVRFFERTGRTEKAGLVKNDARFAAWFREDRRPD